MAARLRLNRRENIGRATALVFFIRSCFLSRPGDSETLYTSFNNRRQYSSRGT
jgi:hypothetical protein